MTGTAVHSGVARIGARIGPNAIIRLAEALDASEGRSVTSRLFGDVRLERYLAAPPQEMVAEEEVTALYHGLRSNLGEARARSVSWGAGVRTADYLLANRIPRAVQALLKILPAGLASRILLNAIGKHAWTFAGSGQFTVKAGHPVRFAIAGCPICRGEKAAGPCCDFYAATFERLFSVLVSKSAKVTETECTATGAPACRFEIKWR